MSIGQRKRADFAFGCYLLIAVCLAVELLMEVADHRATSREAAANLQVLGMVVLLPLAIVSIVAAVIGVILSLSLADVWQKVRGVAILPALLVVWLFVFAMEEDKPGPYFWTLIVAAAYVVLGFVMTLRWFAVLRRRIDIGQAPIRPK